MSVKLRACDDDDKICAEHQQILDSRISAYESGTIGLLDWEEVKTRLLNKYSSNIHNDLENYNR